MELYLIRTYFERGTNGRIEVDGELICYAIELPWRNNERRVSCIPEGRYALRKRYSSRFDWHLEVMGVADRSFILFHPANDALKELNGCIAPVSQLTGVGKGTASRIAFSKLKELVYPKLERLEEVFLVVES